MDADSCFHAGFFVGRSRLFFNALQRGRHRSAARMPDPSVFERKKKQERRETRKKAAAAFPNRNKDRGRDRNRDRNRNRYMCRHMYRYSQICYFHFSKSSIC